MQTRKPTVDVKTCAKRKNWSIFCIRMVLYDFNRCLLGLFLREQVISGTRNNL